MFQVVLVSYSSVVSGTSHTAVPPHTSGNGRGSDSDMAELKEMMRALMQQNVEERKEAKIARREAREKGRQVQRWATACRSLDLQVKELQKAVETLSQASFCSGSTLSSVSASLERVRRAQKDNPIPMEVVLNPPSEETATMASTLEGNSQEKDDSIVQEEEENVGRPSKQVQKEITPEKRQSEDELTAKSNEPMDDQLAGVETTETPAANINMSCEDGVQRETKATDGFQTPRKKHRVPAAALKETTAAMEGVIVTNNPYLPLTNLGTTRSRGNSPKKSPTSESPRKKKTKVNPAFMQAMDDAFAKQQEAVDSGLDQKLPGKEDVGVSLIGRFNGAVKAVVAATGLGTDEAIQDDYVTGERNWQDSWENSSNSGE